MEWKILTILIYFQWWKQNCSEKLGCVAKEKPFWFCLLSLESCHLMLPDVIVRASTIVCCGWSCFVSSVTRLSEWLFYSPVYYCRILALEKLGAVFNQVAFPLQYTPRKFVIHPESNNLIIIETDHNAYTEATKAQRKQQMAEVITLTSRGTVLKMKLLEKLKFKTFIIIFLPAPPACPSTHTHPLETRSQTITLAHWELWVILLPKCWDYLYAITHSCRLFCFGWLVLPCSLGCLGTYYVESTTTNLEFTEIRLASPSECWD